MKMNSCLPYLLCFMTAIPFSVYSETQRNESDNRERNALVALTAAMGDLKQRNSALGEHHRLSYERKVTDDKDQVAVTRFIPKEKVGGTWQLVSGVQEESQAIEWDDNVLFSADSFKVEDAVLIEDTQAHWIFSVPARIGVDMGEDGSESNREKVKQASGELSNNMLAQMSVTKENPRISHYRVYAEKPFSPTFMAKVKKFDIKMRLGEAWKDGPWVIRSQTRTVEGSFGLFMSIDSQSTAEHSAFESVTIAME